MKYAMIEGAAVGSMDRLHRLLAEQLDFPDWYGGNLDALYDCLTDLEQDVTITLQYPALQPGLYRVLTDSAEENPHIHLCLDS